ncbi:hypothetical protein [Amycolatopsis sp. lyj-109]|uniref:hypothetical protein n=1 Tax=Amycolatopsis sp. lyj-109 TaxID=2789287 RepID=UPI00397A6A69
MTATAEVTSGAAAPPALSRGRVNAVFGAVLLGMLLAAPSASATGARATAPTWTRPSGASRPG